MIQVQQLEKTVEENLSNPFDAEFNVTVDGGEFSRPDCYVHGTFDRYAEGRLLVSAPYTLVAIDESLTSCLFERNRTDFDTAQITELSGRGLFDWLPFRHALTIRLEPETPLSDSTKPEPEYIEFSIMYDPGSWKRLWSAVEYHQEFAKVLESEIFGRNFTISYEEHFVGTSVRKVISSIGETQLLKSFVEEIEPALRTAHERTISLLDKKTLEDSVIGRYKFPPEVAIFCEQYLQYFVQFLSDAGIEASTNLHHDAGNVLFSVTPKDKTVALETILSALNAYLGMSSVRLDPFGLATKSNTIEVQRLEAQVFSLQSGVRLAMAEIQTKNATIAMQEDHIKFLQNAFDQPSDVPDAIEETEKLSARNVEYGIFKERILFKKWDLKAIEVNVPKIAKDIDQTPAKVLDYVKGLFEKSKREHQVEQALLMPRGGVAAVTEDYDDD